MFAHTVRRFTAPIALAAIALAAPAFAQDKTVKIGVLSDMSGIYSDSSGPNSVIAIKMAVEDSGLLKKGWKIEVLSADHQNKPDVGTNIARQWISNERIDAIADTPNSGVALAVSNVAKEKNVALLNSGGLSSDLTGRQCTANTVSFTYDTYMVTNGTGKALTRSGGDSWFFMTADYAFGHALERDFSAAVSANRGKVLGSVKTPLNSADFSSFLLQAQASRAKVVSLANAGGDTTNSIKQAAEFGIVAGGQKVAATWLLINDVHRLGLTTAQGVTFTESFYWDLNDQTRAWSKRFAALASKNAMPSVIQAGSYAAVLHYLKAMEALGGNPRDGARVIAKMKELQTDDPLFGKGPVRADGRRLMQAYLFEVKKPAESKYPWDYYKLVATIAPEDAARPLAQSECPLIKSLSAQSSPAVVQPPIVQQQAAVQPAPPPARPAITQPPVFQPAAPVSQQAAVQPTQPPAAVVTKDRRIALVIGNSKYKNAPLLPNPHRDATMVADALKRTGFAEVTLQTDLGKEALSGALQKFARSARSADWAVVYYAGHGIEVGGANYLVPIDATLETDRDITFEAMPLSQVLNAVGGANKLRLVVLDACRVNPFASRMKREATASRAITRGFAREEPDAGTLVVYAAKDGEVASDGDGSNSPFSTAFVQNLQKPGIEINRLFRLVRDDVMDATRRAQTPYTYGSLSGRDEFFFVGPK